MVKCALDKILRALRSKSSVTAGHWKLKRDATPLIDPSVFLSLYIALPLAMTSRNH